jgi:hypothetical protein
MTETYTAFAGQRRLAAGPLAEIALAVKRAEGGAAPILIYDDATGKAIDLDTRGSETEVATRYAAAAAPLEVRGRGRPKLGVVAREVTLLPRHWEWLGAQQGGASVALRKLVDEARKREDGWAEAKRAQRRAQDAAYHFMSAMAGDLPGFEATIRALYAGDRKAVETEIAAWPADIRDHALKLAYEPTTDI